MMNSDELNDRFGIEGEIGFAEMDGDLTFITVSNKFADADISLYGAHICSFTPHRTTDILWMSPESKFEVGSAIRGGIPVCFPWFGAHGTDDKMPQHGFARLMNWEVAGTESTENGENRIRLQLNSSEETKAFWEFDFCAEMIFKIGQSLSVTLKVTNCGARVLEYTSALHSYFNLSAIENVAIEGLKNIRYQNQLDSGDYLQEKDFLGITGPVTHHYYDTETPSVIHDPVFNRRIMIEKSGSKNTTVWNPWDETCKQMEDMPDDGYETFVCVETVNKINDTINLKPGEAHETTAVIGLV